MDNKKFPTFIDILSSLCFGIGFLLLLAPFIMNWFIHADYERYIWIINGPYPFDHFGSGPVQVWMDFWLIIGALVFIYLGTYLRSFIRKNNK